jgi:hypothetical protein
MLSSWDSPWEEQFYCVHVATDAMIGGVAACCAMAAPFVAVNGFEAATCSNVKYVSNTVVCLRTATLLGVGTSALLSLYSRSNHYYVYHADALCTKTFKASTKTVVSTVNYAVISSLLGLAVGAVYDFPFGELRVGTMKDILTASGVAGFVGAVVGTGAGLASYFVP